MCLHHIFLSLLLILLSAYLLMVFICADYGDVFEGLEKIDGRPLSKLQALMLGNVTLIRCF